MLVYVNKAGKLIARLDAALIAQHHRREIYGTDALGRSKKCSMKRWKGQVEVRFGRSLGTSNLARMRWW